METTMTVNKRKKNSRLRASHTHGYGSKKKHRGSGHRGGRGRAGSGKRADSKKPSIWNQPNYFGKHGFTHPGQQKQGRAISIKKLEEIVHLLEQSGACRLEKNMYHIDLTKAGYTKLLSTGHATLQMTINVQKAAPHAIEKIIKAGGKVQVLDA